MPAPPFDIKSGGSASLPASWTALVTNANVDGDRVGTISAQMLIAMREAVTTETTVDVRATIGGVTRIVCAGLTLGGELRQQTIRLPWLRGPGDTIEAKASAADRVAVTVSYFEVALP